MCIYIYIVNEWNVKLRKLKVARAAFLKTVTRNIPQCGT